MARRSRTQGATAELMYLSLLCRVHHLQLIHECLSQAVVQMANPGLDPVHAGEFHMANMLQQSHLLTNTATPPCTPHPTSCPINFHIGAAGSQIRDNMVLDRSNPDHINTKQITGQDNQIKGWLDCLAIVEEGHFQCGEPAQEEYYNGDRRVGVCQR